MCAGAHHAAQRLPVDIAHVLEREARRMQQRPDFPHRRRPAERRDIAVMIEAVQPVECLQIDDGSACRVERRERMACARHAHRRRTFADGAGQLHIIFG